eukprot:1143694-Pleurochrysis_carterae.AAC.1
MRRLDDHSHLQADTCKLTDPNCATLCALTILLHDASVSCLRRQGRRRSRRGASHPQTSSAARSRASRVRFSN